MAALIADEVLNGQLLRVLGSAPYGGADIGECLATADLIDLKNPVESWYEQWLALAERVLGVAAQAEDQQSARAAYLRASNYLRAAGSMLMGVPLEQRLVDSNTRQADAFRRGVALLDSPPEIVEIPFGDIALPGYWFTIDDAPRPTLVLLGGYDSCAEEAYFFNGAAGLARGYNVLTFDGPGQGAVLLQHGVVMRPDWENVLPPVMDWLLTKPQVEASKVALIGLSLGAHLAPRAASGEHRFAACVADCGTFDMYATFLSRLPEQVRGPYEAGDAQTVAGVSQMLDQMAAAPTMGWSMRRNLLVHGVDSPQAYIDLTKDYTLKGRAENITCPTFVCNAENDPISSTAPDLVAALTCPKEFVTFTAAEGAGDHCEAVARLLYHDRSFGWLQTVLG